MLVSGHRPSEPFEIPIHSIFIIALPGKEEQFSCFTDEKTQTQRGQVACPRSHRQEEWKWGIQLRHLSLGSVHAGTMLCKADSPSKLSSRFKSV